MPTVLEYKCIICGLLYFTQKYLQSSVQSNLCNLNNGHLSTTAWLSFGQNNFYTNFDWRASKDQPLLYNGNFSVSQGVVVDKFDCILNKQRFWLFLIINCFLFAQTAVECWSNSIKRKRVSQYFFSSLLSVNLFALVFH